MLDLLVNNFVGFLFVFVRVVSVFFSAPILSDKAVPVMIKLIVSLFIAYLIVLVIDVKIDLETVNGWFLAVTALGEMIVGLMIGFFMQFIFWGTIYAGSLIGFDLGLSMAQVFNPNLELNTDAIGQIFFILAVFIFLMMNGHNYILQALNESYSLIPIGGGSVNQRVVTVLVSEAANVFIVAVKIASPIMTTFFIMNIAEGIMSRIIPQMQVFFVLYPVRIAVGFLIIASSFVFFFHVIKYLLEVHEDNLLILIKAMS